MAPKRAGVKRDPISGLYDILTKKRKNKHNSELQQNKRCSRLDSADEMLK